MALSNAPGEWRWERRGDKWWRIHDVLNIEDGPHDFGPEPALRELHDALVDYLAGFDYPTNGTAWDRLRQASADAAVVLKLPGRFGNACIS
jgi:hypothetical protein